MKTIFIFSLLLLICYNSAQAQIQDISSSHPQLLKARSLQREKGKGKHKKVHKNEEKRHTAGADIRKNATTADTACYDYYNQDFYTLRDSLLLAKLDAISDSIKGLTVTQRSNADSLHLCNLIKKQTFINDVLTEKIVNEFTKTEPVVTIKGIGGVGNIENADQVAGNLSLVANFRPMDFVRTCNNNYAYTTYLYMIFNTRTAYSSDTITFAKNVLFPDISKRDFVIGLVPSFLNINNGWRIEGLLELSLNKYNQTADSSSSFFKSTSGWFGFRGSKIYSLKVDDNNLDFGFQISLYYNFISIDPKYFKVYNQMLGETDLPPTFHTVGCMASVQISKLIVFANMKCVLNKSEAINNIDLKGFNYIIGTMLNTDLLKFNKH